MAVVVDSLETLINGTMFIKLVEGNTYHLFPPLVYSVVPSSEKVSITDSFNNVSQIDPNISTINGVAFAGNYAQLQIDIEAAVVAANVLWEDFYSKKNDNLANEVIKQINFDAFARLRISDPQTIFDSKQISDNQPLFFDDQETAGAGTSSAYNTNQASTTLAVSNLTAGTRVRQSFRRFNYQPGKSFLFIRTAVVGAMGTGITKRIGLFDEKNGLFFQFTTVAAVGVRSYTTGSAVDTVVVQSSWNIDKLDGTGASGITLDFTKTLIYFCDFEWLGVGSVRFGFFINGRPYYCHQVNNSNINTVVYMSTPNLPLRTEIINSGTGVGATITDICSTVIVEGGRQKTGTLRGLNRATNTLTTLNSTEIFPLIGIRLKTTHLGAFLSFVNTYLTCTSSADYAWYLILSPTVVGTAPTWVSLTNSSIEYCYPTNATTLTGGTVLATGIGSDTAANSKGAVNINDSELLLGANIAGTPQEMFFAVSRLTGTTETFYSCLSILETH